MTPRAEFRFVDGAAGRIEVALDWPANGALRGLAGIGHPHPLYGGTLDNKVAATLARTYSARGYLALRLNFRGVGRSDGVHDEGHGETDDLLRVLDAAAAWEDVASRLPEDGEVVLGGFSFGSFVAAMAAQRRAASGRPVRHLALVGTAAGKWPMPQVPAGTLAIHGELDETIPLADVFDWARPSGQPIVVIPGADHFFHGRLTVIRDYVAGQVGGGPGGADAAAAAPARGR